MRSMTVLELIKFLEKAILSFEIKTTAQIFLSTDSEGNSYGTISKESMAVTDNKNLIIYPCEEHLDLDDLDKKEIKPVVKVKASSLQEWCKCGKDQTFGSYPEDGKCKCGIYKHHVHCGKCNKVSQIG